MFCNGGSKHIIWFSLYMPISWIISQLSALGENWFPLLQSTSLMRVSFRAPADTNTHHQIQRKCDECSNNTCHHKTEDMSRRPYNSLMRGNMFMTIITMHETLSIKKFVVEQCQLIIPETLHSRHLESVQFKVLGSGSHTPALVH